MKALRLWLLGAPVVEVDGTPMSVDTRKAVAMLAFLAITGAAHSRAVIADLLWPDLDSEHAAGALRRTLSALRSGLGDDRLQTDRNSVELVMSDAWFDLAESRALAAGHEAGYEPLRRACELHRDDVMAGFSLRDTVRFDDWLRDVQDEVRHERAALLDRLTGALAADGQLDEAVARARERLSLDELHEPTHRRLIELYGAAGRRGEALAQYRECVRVLNRELGVSPLPETNDLYQAISAGGELPIEVGDEQPLVAADELPMVGRDRELRWILDGFQRLADRGALVVIDGESGVGKTRLAQEALAVLHRDDVPVVVARANAGEQGLTYGVIASLLRDVAGRGGESISPEWRAEAARLLPELGPPPPAGLDEPGARLRFLESVSALIASRFDGSAGVVFVDDLQWCDPASLEALAYLANRLEDRRLLLLLAHRADEPDPEHRFARLLELGERITLTRLTRRDVAVLVDAAGLAHESAEDVFRDSEGLPLFVAELIHTAPGVAAAPAQPAVAAVGVRAMLDARLDAVSEVGSQVLGAAALLGRSFDAGDLRAASGRSDEEIAAALEELSLRGLTVETERGYDFTHERLRAATEERLSRARRRLLHGRIAQELSSRHRDPALTARHFELAGDEQRAAAEYAAAGERARGLSASAEAVAHYEAALALGYPDAVGLREALGDVHTLRGEYGAALADYDTAAALLEPGDATVAGRLEHKLGSVHERRGEWELAELHYRQALALGADVANVQADRSRVAWRSGGHERARELGFEALALAQSAGDGAPARAAAAQANNILGLLGCGREYLERSLELSAGLRDPSIRIAALNNLALDYAAGGELEQAEALTREALALCVTQGDRHREAALRNNLADILHRAGQGEGAMEELKQAVSAFAAIGSEGEALFPGVWSLVEW
jgi:DNA-binding SARP family transcriptional activator/type II secretory pathway predicted ATPase ExeA